MASGTSCSAATCEGAPGRADQGGAQGGVARGIAGVDVCSAGHGVADAVETSASGGLVEAHHRARIGDGLG